MEGESRQDRHRDGEQGERQEGQRERFEQSV